MDLGAYDRTWLASPPAVYRATDRDAETGYVLGDLTPFPLHVPLVTVPQGALALVESFGVTVGALADSIFDPYFPQRIAIGPPFAGVACYADARYRVTIALDGRAARQLAPWELVSKSLIGGTQFRFSSQAPPGFTDIPIPLPGGLVARRIVGLLFDTVIHTPITGAFRTAEGTDNWCCTPTAGVWRHTGTVPVEVPFNLAWVDWLNLVGCDSRFRLTGRFVDAVD